MKQQTVSTGSVRRTWGCRAAILLLGLAVLPGSRGSILHHWDFNTDGTDAVSGANATLVGAATIGGGALNLPGGGVFANYAAVNLGNTISNNPTLSVECWYTQNAPVNWSKVWMFGLNNAGGEPLLSYIDFTPHTGLGGNPPKLDFDPNIATELNATGPDALIADGSHQYHVVSTYDAGQNLMSMYVDGVLTTTNSMGGYTITNLGWNTARFGAGFYFGDPDLNGAINDLRIYNHAMNPLQVAVNFAAGPDTVVASYVPTTVYLAVTTTNLLGGQSDQGSVTADFGAILGVPVTAGVTNWSSSKPTVVAVSSTGAITAVGAGNATISAKVAGVTGSVVVYVAAVQPSIGADLTPITLFAGSAGAFTPGALGGNLSYYWYRNGILLPTQTNATLNFAAVAVTDDADYRVTVSNVVGTASSSPAHLMVLQQSLDHRYSFDTDVTDSIGGANGTPVNNVTFAGGAAVFPGTVASGPSSSYIQLPANLITPYASVTFECWATILPNGNWNQICAFGDQSGTAGNTYLAVIPHSGSGDYRMTIKTHGNERATSGAAVLDKNTPVHLVAVYNADSNIERLYANGVQVSTRATTIDVAAVNNVYSWLGRSLFNGDASLKGSIDEFRIWNGPLTPLQIAVNAGLGPNVVSTNAGAYLGLTNVAVANSTMVGGTTQQGTALAVFANVASVPFNSQVTNWFSSNTNVATVTATGLIKAVGTGTATISATALGSTASVVISVLAVQPTIQQPPVSVTRYAGGGVILSVGAGGGQLQYQWSKAGTPLPGQTTASLVLDNLSAADAADYRVLVSNPAGSTNSAIAHLTVSATLPGGYAGLILGDHPSAYWRLDETNGTRAVDLFGTNYGTYSGGVVLGGAGVLFGDNDAAVHVVAGGKAEVPFAGRLNNPAGPFSAEVWVRPDDGVAAAVLSSMNRVVNDRSGYALYHNLNGNFFELELGNPTGIIFDLRGGTPLVVSNWYHVVATYDGTNANLYVNGQLDASGAVALPPFNPNPAAALEIGVENGGGNPNNGQLDEVAVYGSALTAAQVNSHYAAGIYNFTTPPLLLSDLANTINYQGSAAQVFNVAIGGSLPLHYQWQHQGTNLPGATSATLRIPNPRLTDAGTYQLWVTNTSGVTNSSLVTLTMQPTVLAHRWSFITDPTDPVGGADAALVGRASVAGGQLQLPGGGLFESFAAVDISATLQGNASVTVESWFTLNALVNWSKLWMFGDGSAAEPLLSYIDFTPRTGLGGNPPKIDFDPLDANESNSSGGANPPALVAGQTYHVVVVYDAANNSQRFYLNGTLADSGPMGGESIQQLNYSTMRFGSGFFYGDPDLNGSIDEMRVYAGVLTPEDAVNDFAAGPDTLVTPGTPVAPVTLQVATGAGGTLSLSWTFGVLQQADVLAGPWTEVAVAVSPYAVTPTGVGQKFYRVKVP